MKFIVICFIGVLFAGCRFNHHEQMAPHWVSAPSFTVDCTKDFGTLIVEGMFQGQDVYVQNPVVCCNDTTTPFCAYAVAINDSIFMPRDSILQSAFRIPLIEYGFNQGDSVHIVISHYNGGTPKVLNPEVH